jgi:hypothetical protein
MPKYIYMWAYIQKHPQETKRLLGIEYPTLLELISYGKLLYLHLAPKLMF